MLRIVPGEEVEAGGSTIDGGDADKLSRRRCSCDPSYRDRPTLTMRSGREEMGSKRSFGSYCRRAAGISEGVGDIARPLAAGGRGPKNDPEAGRGTATVRGRITQGCGRNALRGAAEYLGHGIRLSRSAAVSFIQLEDHGRRRGGRMAAEQRNVKRRPIGPRRLPSVNASPVRPRQYPTTVARPTLASQSEAITPKKSISQNSMKQAARYRVPSSRINDRYNRRYNLFGAVVFPLSRSPISSGRFLSCGMLRTAPVVSQVAMPKGRLNSTSLRTPNLRPCRD